MSLLMVVQPLLDAGKNKASGMTGKNQGSDANPFESLLKGQMAAREPEKQGMSDPASNKTADQTSSASQESQTQAGQAGPEESMREAAALSKVEEKARVEDDAGVLAQIMAAAIGTQIVPVEPPPVDDAAPADESAALIAATDLVDDTGGKMRSAAEMALESASGREGVKEGADESAYGKVHADVGQDMNAPVGKTAMEAAPEPKEVAVETVEAKSASEQPTVQTQPQPVPVMQGQQVQQAQMAPAAVQADPAAGRIMQQMGTPEWNQAVGQRVLWMVGQEQQSASLTLNPPELGPVRIVVSVSNNHASANFFSSNPDVRQALEGSLPRLREMMEGAGIQLGQAQVGAENSGNPQSGQASVPGGGRIAGAGGSEGDAGGTATADAPASKRTISRGMIDTFA